MRRRSAGLLVSVLLNLNLALLIPVYAAVVALLKPPKRQVFWWLATTAPVAAAAHGQVRQGVDTAVFDLRTVIRCSCW